MSLSYFVIVLGAILAIGFVHGDLGGMPALGWPGSRRYRLPLDLLLTLLIPIGLLLHKQWAAAVGVGALFYYVCGVVPVLTSDYVRKRSPLPQVSPEPAQDDAQKQK